MTQVSMDPELNQMMHAAERQASSVRFSGVLLLLLAFLCGFIVVIGALPAESAGLFPPPSQPLVEWVHSLPFESQETVGLFTGFGLIAAFLSYRGIFGPIMAEISSKGVTRARTSIIRIPPYAPELVNGGNGRAALKGVIGSNSTVYARSPVAANRASVARSVARRGKSSTGTLFAAARLGTPRENPTAASRWSEGRCDRDPFVQRLARIQ